MKLIPIVAASLLISVPAYAQIETAVALIERDLVFLEQCLAAVEIDSTYQCSDELAIAIANIQFHGDIAVEQCTPLTWPNGCDAYMDRIDRQSELIDAIRQAGIFVAL